MELSLDAEDDEDVELEEEAGMVLWDANGAAYGVEVY